MPNISPYLVGETVMEIDFRAVHTSGQQFTEGYKLFAYYVCTYVFYQLLLIYLSSNYCRKSDGSESAKTSCSERVITKINVFT
jgi:hypothetical protein